MLEDGHVRSHGGGRLINHVWRMDFLEPGSGGCESWSSQYDTRSSRGVGVLPCVQVELRTYTLVARGKAHWRFSLRFGIAAHTLAARLNGHVWLERWYWPVVLSGGRRQADETRWRFKLSCHAITTVATTKVWRVPLHQWSYVAKSGRSAVTIRKCLRFWETRRSTLPVCTIWMRQLSLNRSQGDRRLAYGIVPPLWR